MGLAIPGWRRKPEEETMKNQLILAFLLIAMAGCAASPDVVATPGTSVTSEASATAVSSVTPTITATQTVIFHPTRIFTRTPSQTPSIDRKSVV
jgi:hypothetical protein